MGLFVCFYSTAEIGPPEVQLESVDGVVKVSISPPEANSKEKMWTQHSFSYNAVIWKKSSNAEVFDFQS